MKIKNQSKLNSVKLLFQNHLTLSGGCSIVKTLTLFKDVQGAGGEWLTDLNFSNFAHPCALTKKRTLKNNPVFSDVRITFANIDRMALLY